MDALFHDAAPSHLNSCRLANATEALPLAFNAIAFDRTDL